VETFARTGFDDSRHEQTVDRLLRLLLANQIA
jgi:hypothetical protein